MRRKKIRQDFWVSLILGIMSAAAYKRLLFRKFKNYAG